MHQREQHLSGVQGYSTMGKKSAAHRSRVEYSPKHDDRAPIVMIKIDSFRDFAPSHGKENRSSTIITSASVVFESDTRLVRIGCFHKDELVFPHLRKDVL